MSLVGKRVVNTRATYQAAELDALLHERGAVPLAYPCIVIVPPEDMSTLDTILATCDFDLLLLTSANTVSMLAQRLRVLGRSFKGLSAAAIGPATAQAAREQLGVEITLIPDEFSADGLREAISIRRGMRILLPKSEIAKPELVQVLNASGADVTAITAYRTVRGTGGVALPTLLRNHEVDAVTFTSSSTARFFVERLKLDGVGEAELDGVIFASIGAQTSRTARDCGLTVAVEAQPHTLQGLVNGIAAYFQDHP